jgi:hypothetical protein
MEKDSQASLRLIDDTCDRLHSALNACRQRLKEKVTSVHHDIKQAVAAGKAELLGRKVKVTSHQRVVERAQSLRSTSATDLAASLEARVKALDTTTTLTTEVMDMKAVTLTMDPKVIASIEEALASLGTAVSVSTVASDSRSTASLATATPGFKFHHNHGSNIILSNNQMTATQKMDGAIKYIGVVGSDPMQVDALYEVSQAW